MSSVITSFTIETFDGIVDDMSSICMFFDTRKRRVAKHETMLGVHVLLNCDAEVATVSELTVGALDENSTEGHVAVFLEVRWIESTPAEFSVLLPSAIASASLWGTHCKSTQIQFKREHMSSPRKF